MCSAAHFCNGSICECRQDSRNRWRQLCAPFGGCWLHAQQNYLGSSTCQNPERLEQGRVCVSGMEFGRICQNLL
jgi:hypothetical protein